MERVRLLPSLPGTLSHINLKAKEPGARWRPAHSIKDRRRPTLAEAIQPLPSALQRLTAVFGMGTGRSTAVLSPEIFTALAVISSPNRATRALAKELAI